MSMLTVKAGLALVALMLATSADPIREPDTGKTFDVAIKGTTPDVTLTCTGAGCRKATALGVKVYAIAQWIDAAGARTALAAWQGKSGKDLASSQPFYDALSAADVEKRLRLVFVRNVSARELHDGFEESLEIAYSGTIPPAGRAFLDLFRTDVKKDQAIELRSLPGGVIEVVQHDKSLGKLPPDRTLATAVWAIYFHEKLADSHLVAVKPELVARIGEIWNAPPSP